MGDDPPGMHKMYRGLESGERTDPDEDTSEVLGTKQNTERVRAVGRKRKSENCPTGQDQFEGKQTTRSRLRPGERIVAQDMKSRRWTTEAMVIAENRDGTSYRVEINGKIHTRSRKFLRKLTGPGNFGQIDGVKSVERRMGEDTIRQQQNKISRPSDGAEDSINKTSDKSPGVTTWENNK